MKQVAVSKMFTFRLNSYQFLQYLLIFSVSSEVFAEKTLKKCAEFNEYCLNHWDCCSNSCMSYLYRCTRGHTNYPYPFLGISYKPTVSLEQILEQNFGNPNTITIHEDKPYNVKRFDGNGHDFAATEIKIVLQKADEPSSETTTLRNPVDYDETTTGMKNHLNEETTEILTNVLAEANQTTIKISPEKASCAEIGEKCYEYADCCSNRCHGYLHKCVT